MQENYKILGITENASDEEVENAYKTIKERYMKERFCEGEVGNEAARNLTKIESAYSEIIEDRKIHKTTHDGETKDFSEIEKLIKSGNISEAQIKLDEINERDAEWHYLQSVVFYKKNWINESKKQLEIAMNMDPHNTKYADSYTKLKQKIEFNEKQFHSGNADYGDNQSGTHRTTDRQMGGCNECFQFCATWCCMNFLCNSCCR